MKAVLAVLMCTISVGVRAGGPDLMFASGNAYFNNCTHLESRPDLVAVPCVVASSNSFIGGRLVVATRYNINVDKYFAYYQMEKIDGRSVHLQLLDYLKKHPAQRGDSLASIASFAILENYPLSDELIKKLK